MRRILLLTILLAHGCEDDAVPFAMAADVMARAQCQAECVCGCSVSEVGCVEEHRALWEERLTPASPDAQYDPICMQAKLELIAIVGCRSMGEIAGDVALELAQFRAECPLFHGDLAVGDECDTGVGTCGRGLECNRNFNTCFPRQSGIAIGERCNPSDQPRDCEIGGFCVAWGLEGGSRCEHTTNLGGTCRGLEGEGECDPNADQICDQDSFTCVRAPGEGEPCGPSESSYPTVCDEGLGCRDRVCEPCDNCGGEYPCEEQCNRGPIAVCQ